MIGIDLREYLIYGAILIGVVLLISNNWRGSLAALSILYLIQFLILIPDLAVEQAAIKLVSGWMSASILAITMMKLPTIKHPPKIIFSARVFRGVLFVAFWLVVQGTSSGIAEFLTGISLPVITASILILSTGLLIIGFSSHPLNSAVGLLVFLIGFESIYTLLVDSLLVLGLLAVIHLSISMTFIYLMQSHAEEEGLKI